MMNLAKYIPIVLGSSLLVATTVNAADNQRFEDLDTDGNGYISQSEASALPCLADAFNDIDTESDQGLNRGEYLAAVQEHCSDRGESGWPSA